MGFLEQYLRFRTERRRTIGRHVGYHGLPEGDRHMAGSLPAEQPLRAIDRTIMPAPDERSDAGLQQERFASDAVLRASPYESRTN